MFIHNNTTINNEYASITIHHKDGPAAAEIYAGNIADRLNKYESLKVHGSHYVRECQRLRTLVDELVASHLDRMAHAAQDHKLQRIQCAGLCLFVGAMLGMVIVALMVQVAR